MHLGNRFAQRGPFGRGHHRIGESGIDRIRTVHGLPGETEISANLAWRMRQQPGAADIGEKAEADFGHRKFCLLRHHAMSGMRREADATAHDEPIHERDVRLRILRDPRVHDVFLAPEYLAEIAANLGAFPETADIATRAKASLAGAFQHDDRYRRVRLELIERRVDAKRHLQRHGIDRLRTVEPDDPGRTLAPHDQVGFGRNSRSLAHRPPSISLRDTISRMISLVPSSI
ncbi:hypothetical protein ES703_123242 [subsurface metagenome]